LVLLVDHRAVDHVKRIVLAESIKKRPSGAGPPPALRAARSRVFVARGSSGRGRFFRA
jgi:hypothetical protein